MCHPMSILCVTWTPTGKQLPSPLHPFQRRSCRQSHPCSGKTASVSGALCELLSLVHPQQQQTQLQVCTTSHAMLAKLTSRARGPTVQANMASLLLWHVIVMGVNYDTYHTCTAWWKHQTVLHVYTLSHIDTFRRSDTCISAAEVCLAGESQYAQ